MITTFIFDLDGVIVDTAKYHFQAWKTIADFLDIRFTEPDNERLKGVNRMESLDIILEIGNIKLDYPEKSSLANKKNDVYKLLISQLGENDILPGVKNVIDELTIRQMKKAVASSSKNARTILNHIGLTSYFDTIVDGYDITFAKPDPEIFLKVASTFNVLPAECIVLEDAIAGIHAAKNAGMKVIGIGNPGILKDADSVIQGFQHITVNDILEKVNEVSNVK